MNSVGLWNIASARPDMLAVVDPGGQQWTYAQLAERADRYGRGLRAKGLEPGESFAMDLPNGVELLALHFAAMQTGLYVVPLNWHLVGPEIAHIIEDSGAKVFVGHERFAGTARAAADESGLPADSCFAVGAARPGARPGPVATPPGAPRAPTRPPAAR